MARCTLSVSCSTDLDQCVVFVDGVCAFLEHVHRNLTASQRLSPNFVCRRRHAKVQTSQSEASKNFVATPQPLQHSVKIWIDHRPASKSVITTKLPGSCRTAVFVIRTKVFANPILEHHSRTMFTKTVRILINCLKDSTVGIPRMQKLNSLLRTWSYERVSFKCPPGGRVGNTAVGRLAGWITSMRECLFPHLNCSWLLSAGRTGNGFHPNRPSWPLTTQSVECLTWHDPKVGKQLCMLRLLP